MSGLAESLKTCLSGFSEPPVILCIGSDRVTGDCLGPITGHFLKHEFSLPAFVYGSLSDPVTALNLKDVVEFISEKHPCSPIIAIDSALGKKGDVGTVRLLEGGIYPGAATSKSLPKVGDFAVTATVAENAGKALYSVRLGLIFSLSRIIAEAFSKAFKMCGKTENQTDIAL